MGHQWGVPAEFLLAGAAYTYEQAWAFSLLHDVPVRPNGTGKDLDLIASIWKVMEAFGRKEAEWLPYWRNTEWAKISPASVYVSLYRHPENGILAVVSNLGGKKQKIRLALDTNRLGLEDQSLRVNDVLQNESIPAPDGIVRLRLQGLEWKLLWISKHKVAKIV